ncbi:hypothetical protein AMTR_s00025p00231840 [Amborella trichopoda]|uniref:Leucine-rich repeat-containing N-terminal plant-type domain-containing protein n=1 Tax=Amborella trichopoda TaxID=13333 RepID=W1PXD7_AMBTC|nr:hypothetical protein AMTR_s00025p00231840 [Amborella trichopoda]
MPTMPPPLSLLLFSLSLLLLSLSSQAQTPASSGQTVTINPTFRFQNPSLRRAYYALQTWKKFAIFSDPFNQTGNWIGPDVCHYNGVFCAPSPSDSSLNVVAGIDLNHADIAGYLPPELGLLSDLALFHINSNRFCGVVPPTFKRMKLLFELDLSNNRFVGHFPAVVLKLPLSSTWISGSMTSKAPFLQRYLTSLWMPYFLTITV